MGNIYRSNEKQIEYLHRYDKQMSKCKHTWAMLTRTAAPFPGLAGLSQNFFNALGVLDGVGSRSRFCVEPEVSEVVVDAPSSCTHLRNTGRSCSILVSNRTQGLQILFDFVCVFNTDTPTCINLSAMVCFSFWLSKISAELEITPDIRIFLLQKRQQSFTSMFT